METTLRIRALDKRYGRTWAIRGIDLEIDAPGVCTILGPNGAGKSTLVRCALGLTKPSAGEIRVFGETAGSVRARRRTGALLQDTQLPDTLTPREHLSLFATYFGAGAAVDEHLHATRTAAFADMPCSRLSVGQKQQVQFAAALTGRPELLFLDEPTAGMDVAAKQAVWEQVRRRVAAGATVILTTHQLDEADALADRVVVLREGMVIADETPAAFRSRVGGALIRCRTAIVNGELRTLPAVGHVEMEGTVATLFTQDAPATLAALLARDPSPADLTVRKPSLEHAFLQLTGGAS
jgi:ABC-2 type transport system ATP-binding protein